MVTFRFNVGGKVKIGFIGQGWIGKNYANDFEKRGFEVVRYSLEPPYDKNKRKIKFCDIVFIAVPTPTTPEGFDSSIVEEAVKNIGKGKTVVIKSTIMPGTTEKIQAQNPDIFVMHSPEFLRESSAAEDSAHPQRNILGLPRMSHEFKQKAKDVLDVLPEAPFSRVCTAKEAEFIKYAGNCFLYAKVVFVNMLYDLAKDLDCDWNVVRDAMVADSRIGESHMDPVHQSGRGAGGHCFIKDFAAFKKMYQDHVADLKGMSLLKTMEEKNIDLLLSSDKDLDLLAGVYGNELAEKEDQESSLSSISAVGEIAS